MSECVHKYYVCKDTTQHFEYVQRSFGNSAATFYSGIFIYTKCKSTYQIYND